MSLPKYHSIFHLSFVLTRDYHIVVTFARIPLEFLSTFPESVGILEFLARLQSGSSPLPPVPLFRVFAFGRACFYSVSPFHLVFRYSVILSLLILIFFFWYMCVCTRVCMDCFLIRAWQRNSVADGARRDKPRPTCRQPLRLLQHNNTGTHRLIRFFPTPRREGFSTCSSILRSVVRINRDKLGKLFRLDVRLYLFASNCLENSSPFSGFSKPEPEAVIDRISSFLCFRSFFASNFLDHFSHRRE